MRTFTHNTMSSLLNLQGVIIYKIDEYEKEFIVKIGQPRKPTKCPFCSDSHIIKHGKGRKRKLKHGQAVNGKKIILHWQGKRFKCNYCHKTWSTKPPDSLVRGEEQSTKYCKQQALRMLQNNSFNNTKKQTGLSYNTLKQALHTFMIKKPLLDIPKKGNLILGIDEHARAKQKLATTITLLYPKQQLLGLLPHATSKELINWSKENMNYETRLRVKEIGMDMTKSLRRQLKILFPNAKFVMDHFHVIAYLNRLIAEEYRFLTKYGNLSKKDKLKLPCRGKGMGIVRLLYRGSDSWNNYNFLKIKTVFEIMPRVAELWYAKEEVRSIYRECKSKNEARERWQFVLSLMPDVARNTLTEKLEEILNYFDNKTTTGFTEGVHTKVKLLKRISYGLKNPQVYVEKLEFGFVKPELLIGNHTF